MACISSVEKELYSLEGVEKVAISLEQSGGTISGEQLPGVETLKAAVSSAGDYQLEESNSATFDTQKESSKSNSSYKPLLLVVVYLVGFTALLEWSSGMFLWETWMPNFMAGFFIVFSFFKMLDIRGFAQAYMGYDIIAKRLKAYAYAFPFIELGLGLAYVLFPDEALTHLITAIVMFVSLVGVVNAVLRKQQIRCACLGTVFNLPMSSVTIIEDSIMLIMALLMYLK